MLNKLSCTLNYRTIAFLAIFGVFFIIGAFYSNYKVLPGLIRNKIYQMKVLEEGTEPWNMFMKMPFPFTFKVYLFDVQNPQEIMSGAVPIVKETGPFCYKIFRWKSEIERESSDEISYYSYTRFEFDDELSGDHTEEDTVTVLNTPYLSLLYVAEETQPSALSMIDGALPSVFGKNNGLFVKVKVKDYLFDGLKICENGGTSGGFVTAVVCKQMLAQISRAKNMRLEKNNTILFSALHYKNNTHLGRFTVKSGVTHKEETAVLKKFNGHTHIKTWAGEKSLCNEIRGLTTVFPNPVTTDMVFESFAEDICRVMKLEYKEEETVKDILGFRFASSNSTFNYSINENKCFCTVSNQSSGNDMCLKNGVMDLAPCTGGPVVLSFPHLMSADKEYSATVKGLHPKPSRHETFVTLEPTSGFPLKLAQRVQFNMFTRPVDGILVMENVTRALIPFMWVEESTTLNDDYINMLKTKLFSTLHILDILKWIFIGAGVACVLLSLFLVVYMKSS